MKSQYIESAESYRLELLLDSFSVKKLYIPYAYCAGLRALATADVTNITELDFTREFHNDIIYAI